MNTRKANKKEILYRSMHRGCKETDFLISGYVEGNIDNLTDSELLVLKDLILEDDLMIYEWVLGKKNCFDKYKDIIKKMQLFHGIA